MNLLYKVKKTIEKERLIEIGDRVLVGISGGIDSTSLLYVLHEISKEMSFEIGGAHLNHLLRGEESERDERFAEGLGQKLSFLVYIRKADAKGYAEKYGLSIQHAGRDLRYNFFEEIADRYGFNKIAIAHNLDDQAETFILRMVKGTGMRGLSSVPVRRGRIIRPFLCVYRSEIEDYAGRNSITYVHDSSNDKTVYERNFVRKQVVPLMEQVNPLFKEKIISLLEDFTTINKDYDSRTDYFLKNEMKSMEGDLCFRVDALRRVEAETRFRVIVHVFARLKSGFMPLRDHIRLIDKVLWSEKPNQSLFMPFGIRVKKIYDKLVFTRKPAPTRITDVCAIMVGTNRLEPFGIVVDVLAAPADQKAEYPADKYAALLDGDKVGNLSVRTFLEGDRFYPLGMKSPVKLKDFFISQKIPREERRHIPLLLSGKEIVWVVGYRIDERYKITEETKRIFQISARKA